MLNIMNILHSLAHALRRMASRTLATSAVTLFLVAHALPSAASVAHINFSPAFTTVSVGDVFSIDLNASQVDNGIGAWNFVLGLSTMGIASLDSVTFSSAFSGSDVFEFDALPELGAISFITDPLALIAFQGTEFTLATLAFTALAPGSTQLNISAPQFGELLADAYGLSIADAQVGFANITVVPTPQGVPEPHQLVLLLIALSALLVTARRSPG
jgi:hypothetical protein